LKIGPFFQKSPKKLLKSKIGFTVATVVGSGELNFYRVTPFYALHSNVFGLGPYPSAVGGLKTTEAGSRPLV